MAKVQLKHASLTGNKLMGLPGEYHMTSTEKLQAAIINASNDPSVEWSYRDLDSGADKGCSICGDFLTLGTPGEVQFGADSTLPIHKECHLARNGLSSRACRLSMIGYSFLIRASMDPKGWAKRFLAEFVRERGSTAGTYLIGHGIPWWDRLHGFQSVEELVRWSRWCHIYERDAGKFTSVGKEIPHWDEDQESWREYMACDRKRGIYGTFYTALRKEPRIKRGVAPKCNAEVLDITSGRCGICFDTIQIEGPHGWFSGESDHILPDSKGGLEALENIQPTHRCCNRSKSSISGGHAPLAWMLGRFALNQLNSPDGFSIWKSLVREAVKKTKRFADRF